MPVSPASARPARGVAHPGRAERAVVDRLDLGRAVPVQPEPRRPGRPRSRPGVRQPSSPPGRASTVDQVRGRSRRADANCSRTTVRLHLALRRAGACCQSQPPHRPGPAYGHGGGDPVRRRGRGPRPRRRGRTSRRRSSVTTARTRSPGRACRTNTTRPSCAGDAEPAVRRPRRPRARARRPDPVGSVDPLPGPAPTLCRDDRCGTVRPGHRAAPRRPTLESSCHGTLVTITPGWNSSRPLSRSADWLCSNCSHQCPTTYSGMNTLTTSRGRSARSYLM